MRGILYAASEGLPFIKSGGLADVIGSLPDQIDPEQYKVAVVLPYYKKIAQKYDMEKVQDFHVHSGIIEKDAQLYHYTQNGLDYYFIGQSDYFDRDQMYGYNDDGERFAFYAKAVLEMISFIPYSIDIIHCHDWHTGMIPILCKEEYQDDYHQHIKTVFTIHNLLFQGSFSKDMLNCFDLDRKFYDNGVLKFDDGINYMKAGILYADKVTTVSDSYAHEILTREYGERLENVLQYRQQDLVGIVNGIDTNMWNPATDKVLPANYSVEDLENKKICKRKIQEQLGLRVADDVLLIGMISRMTWQKGASLLLDKIGQIMNQDVQLIILGTGDTYIEDQLKRLEFEYPHRAVFYCGYNEQLSHEIYAGLDLFLMPSLFEPCGISQLISMRYGTLPLVREVGGLKDTVQPYNQYDKSGTGFSFKNFNGDEMVNIIKYAIYVYYYQKQDWNTLITNAMNADVSWQNSARKYVELYNQL